MQFGCILALAAAAVTAQARPASSGPRIHDNQGNIISGRLFAELEELARIVDISYCVGTAGLGIQKPFQCLSRCSDFESFELVKTFNTGPLLSDSCGYIALSHPPARPRIIIAFRGTYSIANTIADLSTVPQEYVPYPGDDDDNGEDGVVPGLKHILNRLRNPADETPPADPPKCEGCMVHTGFYTSWLNTRKTILPELSDAILRYPDYTLTLVGHSLGGAVAGLASLDFKARGWDPHVTTFGEPRLGNQAFNSYIDERFNVPSNGSIVRNSKYRRVTHASDPVPLLPLEEWGYHMHAGEVFISKQDLPPAVSDIRYCAGDEDESCIAGADGAQAKDPNVVTANGLRELQSLLESHEILPGNQAPPLSEQWADEDALSGSHWWDASRYKYWPIPTRYKLWQLFFAHRDYFWRIGLCVPGGDPRDWYRKYPHYDDGDDDRPEL